MQELLRYQMAKTKEFLELFNNFMLTSLKNAVTIYKAIVKLVLTFLQDSQVKVEQILHFCFLSVVTKFLFPVLNVCRACINSIWKGIKIEFIMFS